MVAETGEMTEKKWPSDKLLTYTGLSRKAWEKMEEEIYAVYIRDEILKEERIKNIITKAIIENVLKIG